MESFRETLAKHTKIVGLKWNKLEERSPQSGMDSPVTRSMARRNALAENVNREQGRQTGMLKRAQSVRDAFGTLRQKLRASTRRKKRLVNVDSPILGIMAKTPASQRKTSRKSLPYDTKMYSPFTIDTPNTRTTPRAIRMGVHQPKRFNFSASPGQVQRDVNALAAGIEALSSNGSQLNKAIDGMTPMRDIISRERSLPQPITPVRRASPRRTTPIFV